VLGEAPFDASFESYGWEDIDLGWRLAQRGVRIVFDRAASARHLHPSSLRTFWRRQIHVGGTIEGLLRLRPELRGNSLLPPERPPKRWHLTRWLIPPALPVLEVADRAGLRLPRKVYREVVNCGFYLGRQRQGSTP